MAAKSAWYGQAQVKAMTGEINWLGTSNIKAMLCTSSYNPNQDTHAYKSDVVGEVSNGNGYVEGGMVLNNTSIDYVMSAPGVPAKVLFKADNPSWENITVTCRYCVIYDNTNEADNQKPLLGWFDFGQDRGSYNGQFSVIFSSNGCLYTEIALPS